MNSSAQSNWKMQTLGDLGEVVSGGTPSRTVPSFWNGSIPWATPTDITRLHDKYISTTAEKITENGLAGSSAHLLPAGSLLVTSRATLGEAAIATVPIATNQGFKSIVPNAETHRVFAYYLVKTLKPKMLPLASGTTFLEIGKGDFCRIPVRIPDFDEQSRIAYVLDTIDEAIQKTEAVIAKLKQIRAGMLHDLLTYGLDKDGKLRDPIAHPEQFKDSELGRIPKEWEVVSIEQLGAKKRHAIVDGPFGSNLKSEHYRGAGIPVIQSGFVTSGSFVARHYFYVDMNLFLEQQRSAVEPGDIVMAKIGAQCGMCAIMPEWHPIGILAGNSLKISTDSKLCIPEYLLHVLHRYYALGKLDQVRSETAQPAISLKSLRALLVPRPDTTEQQAINACVSRHGTALLSEQRAMAKLKSMKAGLMDDLLSGDVFVPANIIKNEEALND